MSSQLFPFQDEPDHRKTGRRRLKEGFLQPRQAEDHWQMYRRGLSITRPVRNLPAWLLPLLSLVLIVALVFWAVPAVINRVQAAWKASQDTDGNQASLLYGETAWTVIQPAADVFDRDDLKAGRLTQVLFNEPVWILPDDCTYGFVKVSLNDGMEGFMLRKDLMDSRESIEPDLFSYKIVIAATSKRVMSHASKGTLLAEVLMGTVLFADYRGDGISRVRLPGGTNGWISDDGVIILPPLGKVTPAAEGARYFCTTALAFNQVTFLQNGQSIRGISSAGLVRLAGLVNGVSLPRSIAGMSQGGIPVNVARDGENGPIKLDAVKAGDIVFLADSAVPSDPAAAARPSDVALYLGSNQILYARPGQLSIRVLDLTQNADLWQRIILVRRLFP